MAKVRELRTELALLKACPKSASDPRRNSAMEKARRPSLEPGFSLLHWQKLSMDADLTGGVGKADPDDEASWRAWPRAEIRTHSTRDDFWTIIRGKVYNLTQYLPYHPGGVDILMSTAGRDGTALLRRELHLTRVHARRRHTAPEGQLPRHRAGAAGDVEHASARAQRFNAEGVH